jgi:hypothetical protein
MKFLSFVVGGTVLLAACASAPKAAQERFSGVNFGVDKNTDKTVADSSRKLFDAYVPKILECWGKEVSRFLPREEWFELEVGADGKVVSAKANANKTFEPSTKECYERVAMAMQLAPNPKGKPYHFLRAFHHEVGAKN